MDILRSGFPGYGIIIVTPMFAPGFVLAMIVAAAGAGSQPDAAPIVALAYPGTPAGVPTSEELAAIRAAGFTGVTWAPGNKAAFEAVSTMAAPLNLTVLTSPGTTIKVDRQKPDLQAALWRAIAGGARLITIDPGQKSGTGLASARGDRLPWTYTVATFASQIDSSARLFAVTRPGPAVAIASPAPKGLEVTLLDGGRAWVLIATSTAPSRISFVATLPADVPPALWVSLIDGGTMSMLRQAAGPRWTGTIEPGAAMVFVIDKAPR
jgi:hypothetical protein